MNGDQAVRTAARLLHTSLAGKNIRGISSSGAKSIDPAGDVIAHTLDPDIQIQCPALNILCIIHHVIFGKMRRVFSKAYVDILDRRLVSCISPLADEPCSFLRARKPVSFQIKQTMNSFERSLDSLLLLTSFRTSLSVNAGMRLPTMSFALLL
jgi:hypothetical protein